ncbi:hypothetical protein FB45DRAFT_918744, partial [Roridomyces roridus]
METLLPLLSAALIPSIPNDVLRNTALAIAVLSLVGQLLHRTSPKHQIDALDKVVQNFEEIFDMTTKECTTDPRFIHTTGLKLVEIKYAVSSLRTTTIDGEHVTWKKYYKYRRGLARSVKHCRGEVQDLQSCILVSNCIIQFPSQRYVLDRARVRPSRQVQGRYQLQEDHP